MKIPAAEFRCAGSIFLMKLLGFMNKATKLLLTELVGLCMNILPLGHKQYIYAPTFHSVNKSIRFLQSDWF